MKSSATLGAILRAAIFIDGGYFIKRVRDEGINLDYTQLADRLLAPLRQNFPIDLLRCYFYDCAPWMPPDPNDEELRRMELHRAFAEEIERMARWQVKLGKLERRWDGKEYYFEQKRLDVMLSVDLVRHSASGHIQHAILVAGDSDFIPAVAAAQESGVTVTLWCGPVNTVHGDLAWLADELHRFNWRDFEVPRKVSSQRRSPSAPGPLASGQDRAPKPRRRRRRRSPAKPGGPVDPVDSNGNDSDGNGPG